MNDLQQDILVPKHKSATGRNDTCRLDEQVLHDNSII